jgi:hypothetical protein
MLEADLIWKSSSQHGYRLETELDEEPQADDYK